MSKGFFDGASRYGLPGLVAGLALAWWSGGHGPTARAQGATPGTGSNDVIAFTEPVLGSPSQMLYLVNTKLNSFAVYRVEPARGNASGSVKLEAARNFAYDLKLQGFNNQSPAVSDVGDSNPYAIVVAPVSSGAIQAGDVLVDDFNNISNLQGTGTSILDYNPTTKKTTVFAKLPQNLPQCPGGVGLTAAMTMLKTGWIIVGSTPSTDGTTRTKGTGGLIVLDSNGHVVDTWTGPNINGPWGNVATIDNGSTATVFISMAGFGVTDPSVRDPATGYPVVVNKATVLRLDLTIADGKPPVIASQTVVADGFGERADKDAFLVGPTGLALGTDGTLYLSDAIGNQIVAIPDAATRTDSAGTGRSVSKGGLLKRPLALVSLPNGHLLACNAVNGEVVELDPATGKQLYAQWIDADQAQSPPGNGDLFGIAVTPDGTGFYYVEDDMNTLLEAKR